MSVRPKVGLVQRFIPHYRLPLFKRLLESPRHSWELMSGPHPGGSVSGIPIPDGGAQFPTWPIRTVSLAGGKVVIQRDVVRHIRRQGYQAVVFELGWPIISNINLLRQARKLKIPAIGWGKGIASDGRERVAWRRPYERFLVNQCTAMIVYGKVSQEYIQDLGYPAERIFVAQNTVDVTRIISEVGSARERAQVLRNHLGLNGRLVVGYLGRLTSQKQVHKIIGAFDHIRSQGLDVELVIAGDGPERASLEALASTGALSGHVRFAGEVPVGGEGAYFQLFDLVVSARNAGLAVLEAMAHGRPVLCTPEVLPETEMLERDVTGFIARGYEANDLSESMMGALSNPQHMRELGLNAQTKVSKEATQELMVEAFDSAVSYALQGRPTCE